MILFRNLLGWLMLWFGGWYGWIFLAKRGFNSIKTYRATTGYFLFLSGLVWLFYSTNLQIFFSSFPHTAFPFYILIFFFVVVGVIYFFSHRIFDKNMLFNHYNKRLFVAMMDYRFIITKSFDILFQQLAFVALVMILQQAGLGFWQIVYTAGFIFGVTHLPLLIVRYHSLVKYFVIASFFAGIIFSYLLLSRSYGFVYAYLVHWSFYLFMGLMVNINKSRKKKNISEDLIETVR